MLINTTEMTLSNDTLKAALSLYLSQKVFTAGVEYTIERIEAVSASRGYDSPLELKIRIKPAEPAAKEAAALRDVRVL